MKRRRLIPVLFGGGVITLDSYIKSLAPIAYWPLNELSGTAAINYGSLGTAANGVYSGVTLAQVAAPGGGLAPLWDGANDFLNVYSAALAAAFAGGVGTLGSMVIWAKVSAAGVWTDGVERRLFHINAGADYIYVTRPTANNLIKMAYRASTGGALFDQVDTTISLATWIQFALTWTHDGGDELISYVNGVQSGATQTGLGGWGTALSATGVCIGSFNTTPTAVYSGYLSQAQIYNRVITPTEVATQYALRGV